MAQQNASSPAADRFDGIVDNKSSTLPAAAKVLFLGLIVWGALFCAYYLLSGWNSASEFESAMKSVQNASAPASGAGR